MYFDTQEVICQLPNGCTLYRQRNGAGGHEYWSDEIGCGAIVVWDTSLLDESTLLTAIAMEHKRRYEELVKNQTLEVFGQQAEEVPSS